MAKGRAGIVRIGDFSGGEASVFPFTKMPTKYSVLLKNAYITDTGNIAKIPGYTKVNAASASINFRSGFEFVKSDGTKETLVAGGGSVCKVVGDTLVAIKTGLDSAAIVRFCQINDFVIMVNGVDAPQKYDGSTVGALTGSPPATAFKAHVHKNRVWMLERTDKMLATHSSLNNGAEYTGGTSGYIDFKYVLPEGDELLDILTYIDLLVFIFRNWTVVYSGMTPSGTGADFSMVQMIRSGAFSTDASINVGTDAMITNVDGVKSLKQIVTTGAINLGNLSELVDPTLREKLGSSPATTRVAIAHYARRGWLLFLLGDTVHIYSYQWKAWSRIVGADVLGMFTDSAGNLYFCGTNYIYLYDDTWDFDGNAYEWKWEAGWWPLSKSGAYIYPKLAELIFSLTTTATISIEIKYDLQFTQAENFQSVTIDPAVTLFDDIADFDAWAPVDEQPLTIKRFPVFGRGRIMQMILSNTSTVGPIEVSDVVLQILQGGL